MREFMEGQRVESTPFALERGVFRRPQTGTVVSKRNDEMLITVVRDGTKTRTRYSRNFWKPIEDTNREAASLADCRVVWRKGFKP